MAKVDFSKGNLALGKQFDKIEDFEKGTTDEVANLSQNPQNLPQNLENPTANPRILQAKKPAMREDMDSKIPKEPILSDSALESSSLDSSRSDWRGQFWRVAFLSVLYSGKSPKAPGTAGTLLSVFLGLPILLYSAQTLFLLACLLGVIAVREIDKWERYAKKHDEKWIVIDELVGVWLAMSIICYEQTTLAHLVLAFALFRLFDIWKPSIIGRIDRQLKGGAGVVLDDVAAGIVAGLAGLMILFAYDALMVRFWA